MENAADALKMAFAMLIFVIALSISISVYTQARSTADAVFYMTDITNFYDNVEVGKTHRIVGMETIIPTIYRYNLEDYAVTLVGKDGKIISRYSTATDAAVENWRTYLNYSSKGNLLRTSEEKAKSIAFLTEMSDVCSVLEKVWNIRGKSNSDSVKRYWDYKKKIDNDIEKINKCVKDEEKPDIKYRTDIVNDMLNGFIIDPLSKVVGFTYNDPYYSAWWSGDNTEIMKKIDSDISGGSGIRNKLNEKYKGIGLLTTYKNSTFTEYVLEVENDVEISREELSRLGYNETQIDVIIANGDSEHKEKHLEVVYVQN